MIVESKLASLGLPLPDLEADYRKNRSGARFVSHRAVGSLLYLSGTVPIRNEEPYLPGLLGGGLTIEEGQEAARWALIQALSAVKYALGDLDRFDTAIHLTGYVNSAPGFADQPRVINGFSDLMVQVFGEAVGKHARSAVGMAELPSNIPVEIEMILEVE